MTEDKAAARWTRLHAFLLIAAGAWCVLAHQAWPAALIGAGSLLFALGAELRARPGPARLGAANAVTLLRIALVVLLSWWLRQTPGPREALVIVLVFALDGLDGWLARRSGTVSAFGARFDMESDALFVLVCALGLHARGRLGAYVLVPGFLRYLYVLALCLAPRLAREAPRSRLGRYAFSLMIVSIAVSAWPLFAQHALLAMLASAAIVASFARSVYWSLRAV
jgi:phosphatidylglycerophosphate synthase